ncbi:MAG: hypothetical protein BGN85_05860 [Alphaproteobacteria bacterium 64-11]|nr:polysaccharide biosynthesis/export family protein [Alphaproteobacteria bacterium]OJU11738.1 MAG: hypothetical protein BGN85_05860 [Alphaproteobacteria bacterium 64-11]
MGRTISLLLLRASVIVCAGMLLFAVFSHAHADSYANDSYGLSPLPPASQAAAASATAYGGSPGNDESAPAPAQSAPVGTAPQSPQPGFTAAPAANPAGYRPAATNASPYQPAPIDQAPLPQPAQPAYQPASGAKNYGFKPDMRGPQMPARAAPAGTTPYGYRKGDGEEPINAPAPGVQAAYQPPVQAADSNPHDYVLGTGDKIHLTVYDEPDLSGDFMVDGAGVVRLPLIGQIRAAGRTSPQLEAAVGGALANGYLRSPRVSVEVVTYRPFYVVGAVGRPGEYPYVNHMNVLNAIAIAGGFLPSAVESVVYIRPEGAAKEYRVRTDTASTIHPGDVVRVETTVFWDAMSVFSPLNGFAGIAAAGVRY